MTSTATISETTEVCKLLLNAWSAEFALRLKPLNTDRDYLNASLCWVFPEAYFAALFSARAVLSIDNIRIANPEAIEKLLNRWAESGMYGSGFTKENNPLTELMQHRIKSTCEPKRLSGPEAAALHVKLTEKVHALAIIHETYILNRMGAEAFQRLINNLPDYLRNGFVGARAAFLLSDD